MKMNNDYMLMPWIESILTNDEYATDEELVKHFTNEGGLSEKEANKWVSLRDKYLGKLYPAI